MIYKIERKERFLNVAGFWRSNDDREWHVPILFTMQSNVAEARKVMGVEASPASTFLQERIFYQNTFQLYDGISRQEAFEEHDSDLT